MRTGRWLDHLPPWMAWGAVASTGAYAPLEVAAMAVPLLAAAYVERRDLSLYRFRKFLEIGALAVFLALVAVRAGVLVTVVNTLFVLCGVRLCLPRALPQRRQLLLMGFLLFLSTAVSTSDLDFLAWSLLWVAGGGLYLMQLNWEQPALLRQGPPQAAPFRRVPAWTAAAVLLAAGFFVVLPRLRVSMRNLPLGVQGFAGVHAGLSDVLDLSGKGPILGSSQVAMRIVPRERDAGFYRAFGLLRGVVLEELVGLRWEQSEVTQRRANVAWTHTSASGHPFAAEVFLSPNPMAVVPLPYGHVYLEPPEGEQLRSGPGASVRWSLPVRRILDLKLGLEPEDAEPDRFPDGERYRRLTQPGQGTDSALRWSLRTVPGDPPPRELAARLALALRTFRYTLENPSGGAANPLEDFLERTKAGHCEFFASALAIMLRRRGVPARVVNGYRLGPWIAEGGYYLVTQNEAHSWVEFYDPASRGWRTADPTPPAPPSALNASSLMAALERLTDAVKFKWDRDVVRFSDEDQVAGMDWLHAKAGALGLGWWSRFREVLGAVAVLAGLGALAWFLRAVGPFRPAGAPGSPGRLPQLRPLLRAAGKAAPPRTGETARVWMARLGSTRPDRAAPLEALAREADAVAYGGKGGTALARLAKDEAKAWKNKTDT